MEAMFQASRSDLSVTFALATISFTIGMNLAPRLFTFASAPFLVVLCAMSSTLGIALAAAASNLAMVMAGYGVLFGLGGGVAYILAQQGVNMMVQRHKGLVNGYIVGLYPLGAMIAAPLFGWAIADWGLRATLAGLAVTLALTGLLSAFLLRYAGVRLKPAAEDLHVDRAPGRGVVFAQMCLVFFLAAAAGLTVLSQAAGI